MTGRHIGSAITKHVVKLALEELDPKLILAFSNKESALLFENLDGIVVENPNTLSPDVWKLCHKCPRYKIAPGIGKACCERAYDITAIDTLQDSG